MGRALVTDLYELNMAASYLELGMDEPATFSLFVRTLPPERGFLVAAGLESCLAHLESFRFEDEDLAHLEATGFDGPTIEAFRSLRFTGDVWAVPEGTVVLPGEPLLEVTAPLAEAQLMETYLLNQVCFQTTIATKVARCRLAAAGRCDVVDFALRRTQGVEAGMAVARLSAMAGFTATSNVEAARRYGLTAAGTMAHSYVEAFPSEADAFRAFARRFPGRTTFLVDTYDTLDGVRVAIDVIRELGLRDNLGVRLDSGDLAELARQARHILDQAGLEHVRIFASGGLDEHAIDRFVRAGAPIDAVGVGTLVGVSADAPYLDGVYKLVEYGGRPVLKSSPGKATMPGPKQVFRQEGFGDDVVALRHEDPPSADHVPLLEPVLRAGSRTGPAPTLEDARERLAADLARLPPGATRLDDPVAPVATFSDAVQALAGRLRRSGPTTPG